MDLITAFSDYLYKWRSIRLAEGSDTEGLLEICFNDVWGTVCRSGWNDNEARVVCRQLGLPSSCE